MLGIKKNDDIWNWAAYGKHPVAKDYFRLGVRFPLMDSFSEWIEKGYETVVLKQKNDQLFSSWRFWAQDFIRETLICGLIRESSDSMGRPYPLLIMGKGILKEWHIFWDLLPFACEKTWSQLEFISANNFNTVKALEASMQTIRPPSSDWTAFRETAQNIRESIQPSEDTSLCQELEELGKQASIPCEKKEGFLALAQDLLLDQMSFVGYGHLLLKRNCEEIPNCIFIGGTLEKTFLVYFRRPLGMNDFVQLWSVSMVGKG